MNIFVPIPVEDTDDLFLREMILHAEDTDTGTTFDLANIGSGLHLTVLYSDGRPPRRQIMEFQDLVSAWAVALEVDAEKEQTNA
jgi:hypothetical protein